MHIWIHTVRPKVCGHLTITLACMDSKILGIILSSSPFAVIITSTLLRRLSTRVWYMAVGTCVHSATRALKRYQHWCYGRRPGKPSAIQFITWRASSICILWTCEFMDCTWLTDQIIAVISSTGVATDVAGECTVCIDISLNSICLSIICKLKKSQGMPKPNINQSHVLEWTLVNPMS